jgi:hypothetical protein
MQFTIWSRVHLEGGNLVAVVVALPLQTSALAEVRTRNCSSREEAAEQLDSMEERLRLDLVSRGDRIQALE